MFCWSQHLPKPTEIQAVFIMGLTRTWTRLVEQSTLIPGVQE